MSVVNRRTFHGNWRILMEIGGISVFVLCFHSGFFLEIGEISVFIAYSDGNWWNFSFCSVFIEDFSWKLEEFS